MKHNLKSKIATLSAFSLAGGTLPAVTGCSNSTSEFFTVKNQKNGLEIEFCDVGASIYSIKLDGTYLTYHPKDKNVFMNKGATPYYYGKTLGRVAGRFKDGKFSLDGKNHEVQVNEKSTTKNNCLHGGNDALSFKTFKHYISVDKENDCTNITFNYFSPANEAGFPESLDVWVVYTLYDKKDEYKLDTNLYAIPSGKTVINLSTHSLFRLGNSGDVLDYELTIPTNTRAQYDNEKEKTTGQVVIGEATIEEKDIFDFSTKKTIRQDIQKIKDYDPVSGGIDHIWTFRNKPSYTDRWVNLYNPANKINFTVSALNDTVNGFILYSNDYPRAGQIMQSDDKEDTQYGGITIEPYTYFTKDDIKPITYTPEKPFHSSFRYEWTIGK